MARALSATKLRSGLLVVALIAAAFVFGPQPARADLRVCNQTSDPVSIALGYRAQQGWQSEGWWVAQPNQCAIVYQGPLNARYFYIYAANDVGGGAWDGSVFMCTRDEAFTIFGVEDCLARGYERTGFFEVDTQNKSDWTLRLTGPNPTTRPDGGTDADQPGMVPPDEDAPGGAPEGGDGTDVD